MSDDLTISDWLYRVNGGDACPANDDLLNRMIELGQIIQRMSLPPVERAEPEGFTAQQKEFIAGMESKGIDWRAMANAGVERAEPTTPANGSDWECEAADISKGVHCSLRAGHVGPCQMIALPALTPEERAHMESLPADLVDRLWKESESSSPVPDAGLDLSVFEGFIPGPWHLAPGERSNCLESYTVFFGHGETHANQVCQVDSLPTARLIRSAPQLLAYARSLEKCVQTTADMGHAEISKLTAERDATVKRAEEAEAAAKRAFDARDVMQELSNKSIAAARAEVERLTKAGEMYQKEAHKAYEERNESRRLLADQKQEWELKVIDLEQKRETDAACARQDLAEATAQRDEARLWATACDPKAILDWFNRGINQNVDDVRKFLVGRANHLKAQSQPAPSPAAEEPQKPTGRSLGSDGWNLTESEIAELDKQIATPSQPDVCSTCRGTKRGMSVCSNPWHLSDEDRAKQAKLGQLDAGDWVEACARDVTEYITRAIEDRDLYYTDHLAEIIRRHAPDAQPEVVALKARVAELEGKLHAAELKNKNSLANNLCPDHRDKQRGKNCLACEIDQLEKRSAVPKDLGKTVYETIGKYFSWAMCDFDTVMQPSERGSWNAVGADLLAAWHKGGAK